MAKNSSNPSSGKLMQHWQKTRSLTIWTLVVWAFFSFVIHYIAPGIGAGFSYFMAGMGSQVAFAIIVVVFAIRQDKIDAEHGVSG